MPTIKSFRTSDGSKKITTYLVKSEFNNYGLDFGSLNIEISEIKSIDYIFITHEHMDHFMGLLKSEYVDVLLSSRCKIYASNVTKDLIIAVFENSLRIAFEPREIKKIRTLLDNIIGVLFYEKIALGGGAYFRLFPSGHTFGSSMIYLNDKEAKILYTGDMDFDLDDGDRQYNLDLQENEKIDYIIADGTYLDKEQFKDEEFNNVKDNILVRHHNNFLCKPEKTIFFSKKLMSSSKLKDKYCVVFPKEFKWYLNILRKYNYEPFVVDRIVLDSSVYELPEGRIPLYISNKKKERQTNVTGLVGLHISFLDFAYFLQQFVMDKPDILVGHYNEEAKTNILRTFNNSDLTSDFKVIVLDNKELTL